MKLLLDEMWSPEIAVQLRRRNHDVIAVGERDDLRGKPDDVVFGVAQAEGRVIVTENVPDFRPLAISALQRGGSHAGLIFTSNRRYPRHDRHTAGRLVLALERVLNDGSSLGGLERWLT